MLRIFCKKEWQVQNIRINMQTLCGNRWKDEWWLKENWRRDAARFSIPPTESWLKASRGSTSLCTQAAVWWTDCDIGRWVRPDAALALPPRPGELAPPEASVKKTSGLHQRGIISVMYIKEESIIISGKKARAACECAARNTWDRFKGISERTKSKLCRAGASCSSSQRPLSEPALCFLNINLDSVRCLKKKRSNIN